MKFFPFLILSIVFPTLLMATPTISYTLAMSQPSTHLFEVEMSVDGLDTNERVLEVSLPNWRSGRYMILDFAGGIVEFDVVDGGGKKLEWEKTNKSTWRIETEGAPIARVQYKVFANEFNLRTRGLNDERAFVDGAAVFMYLERYRWQPLSLTVVPFDNWHVTTGLDSVAGEKNKFTAPHYEYLADCPLEIGNQKDFSFKVDSKEHILSISGNGNYEADVLIRDITKIVEAHSKFWGGLPYERYLFMLALSPSAGGGTEHINSCVLGARPFIFKNPETYGSFLGLIAHEFFHTWNVKRLRPAAIDKYDWSKESYIEELWIAEGITSYYDDLFLMRSGFLSESEYLGKLSAAIEMDKVRPGNLKQSLAESSFDAWIKYWKNTKHAANFETDYYSRGALVSFALDMTIRSKTLNKKSLDDVMRLMYQRFPLGKGGYTNSDFQNVCEEVAATSLKQFFTDFVHGAKPLQWREVLATAGLELKEHSPEKKPWLGLMLSDVGEKTIVQRVLSGSAAYEVGLDVDDEIIALNRYKVRTASFNSRINEMKEGDTVMLTVFRDDRLREVQIILRNQESTAKKISKMETPTSLEKAVRSSWLGQIEDKKQRK